MTRRRKLTITILASGVVLVAFIVYGQLSVERVSLPTSSSQAAPITQEALGASVTLTSVKRVKKDEVEVSLLTKYERNSPQSPWVEPGETVFTAAEQVCVVETSDGCYDLRTREFESHYRVQVPAEAGRLTVRREVYKNEVGKVSFTSLNPSSLPTRLKVGDTQFAVLDAYPITNPDKHRWGGVPGIFEDIRFYGLEVEMTPGNAHTFMGQVKLSKNSFSTSWSESSARDAAASAQLKLHNGNTFQSQIELLDWKTGEMKSKSWDKAADERTVVERVTGKISPSLAGRIVTRRADAAAASQLNRDIYLYLFEMEKPPLGSFDLTVFYSIPGSGQSAVVTFEDVLIES